jgi:hypothetical protein
MGSLMLGRGLSAAEGRGLSRSSFGLQVSLDLSCGYLSNGPTVVALSTRVILRFSSIDIAISRWK